MAVEQLVSLLQVISTILYYELLYFQIPSQFIYEVEGLFTEAERQISAVDSDDESTELSEDSLISRLESTLVIIEESIHMTAGTNFHTELQLLNTMRQKAARFIRFIQYGCNDCTIPAIGVGSTFVRSGRVGRPSLVLNIEHIEFLRSSGYTWEEVASALRVSRSTIWRRLRELDIKIEKYTDISDSCLDDLVRTNQRQHPNVGQVMLQGFLKQQGVCVQRYRIRESIFRIDPLRRSLRWHEAVTRRTYSVQGANSLWHIDGHHSLIRWRFIVHGGIDGYSRLAVYLTCNTNNEAGTVYNDF